MIKIEPVTENALNRMLVVDPKKRIDWDLLLIHPIMTYLDPNTLNRVSTSNGNSSSTRNSDFSEEFSNPTETETEVVSSMFFSNDCKPINPEFN